MPFGYKAAERALSSGLEGLTGSISQMLMSDYIRKQEEKVAIEREQRMWKQKKEELELVFKYNKDLAKINADLKAERDDNWRNDPYVRALQTRVRSDEATPEDRAMFDGFMEIQESQAQLIPLTEEQLNFLDEVRPQFPTIAIGLYDAELKNAKFAKEIDTANQRIKAMYGASGRAQERTDATARRMERTARIKEHDKLRKTADDLSKRILATKEKLAKEETKVEKWKREESVITPKFKGGGKVTKKERDFLREPETLKGEEPSNIAEIKNLRQQLKDLERKHEIAIQAIGRELETPTGVGTPAKIDPVEEIINEIRAGNIPAEITEAMDADPELTFEDAVEEYIRWKLGIK